MNERRAANVQRERIDQIQLGYERWTRHTLTLLAILVFVQFGLGGLSIYLVGENQRRADENRSALEQIQGERARNVRNSCDEQNGRNRDTVTALDRIFAQQLLTEVRKDASPRARVRIDRLLRELKTAPPAEVVRLLARAKALSDPALVRQGEVGRGQTVLLIDALAPRRDCEQRVRDLVDTATP